MGVRNFAVLPMKGCYVRVCVGGWVVVVGGGGVYTSRTRVSHAAPRVTSLGLSIVMVVNSNPLLGSGCPGLRAFPQDRDRIKASLMWIYCGFLGFLPSNVP